MSLTIAGLIIAETRIQAVALRSVLGAYEILFLLQLTVLPEKEPARCMSIVGARVSVKTPAGGTHSLGFARPEEPFEIRQKSFQHSMSRTLAMSLQSGQLVAIEQIRGAGDLDFELQAIGQAIDRESEYQVQDTWRIHVPRSDWIKKLRDAKALDVLLLEVPMPMSTKSKKWVPIANGLDQAQEHFLNGDYHACVASCRTVVQELGHGQFKKKDWAGPLLSRLASDRNGMTKDEREAALWGALRHYTHQAHHAGSEGGEAVYTRSEAELVLRLTAAFVARVQGR